MRQATLHRPLTQEDSLLEILTNLPFPHIRPLVITSFQRVRARRTLFITPSIRDADIRNLVADLHPTITGRRDREEATEKVIRAAGDDETAEKVEIVDVLGADGDGAADGANEADDVDEDAGDVGRVATPVETEPEIVGARLLGAVEFCDLQVAFADNVVIADDDACN